MSQALYLKHYLTEKIGEILTNYAYRKKAHELEQSGVDVGDDIENQLTEEQKKELKVEVFDVQFAFNNYKLINILKRRGTAITNLDFDTVNKCDE